MGTVWRGIHVEQQIPVAVKVVTAKRAREPRFHRTFRKEVGAVARLHHPGIVVVFDYGEVTKEAEKMSGGRIVAGGPYLAMELVEGGSLQHVHFPLNWPTLKTVLLSLLDTLAHAHARGVVHRDLKPSNVLVDRQGSSVSLKLSDFGLAHALDAQVSTGGSRTTEGSIEPATGTPHYMSPEQCDGRWRDYGPWSDLYTLGCMAYELATGTLPFEGDKFMTLAVAHIFQPPTRPVLPAGTPKQLAEWILRLMKKDPQRRFLRAADAAWALSQVPDPATESTLTWKPKTLLDHIEAADTVADDDDELLRDTASLETIAATALTLPALSAELTVPIPSAVETTVEQRAWKRPNPAVGRGNPDLPPLPTSWRREEAPDQSTRLVGAGLGLYGLRTVPLVDRDTERDLIWAMLESVHHTQSAQAIVLRGPTGVGKSRVAEWLSERAHEVGGATVLKAVHSRLTSPGDGIPGMLLRHFRCKGLPRDEVLERLEQILGELGSSDAYEWNALTELISPDTEDPMSSATRNVRFQSQTQRSVLAQRILTLIGDERPTILWVDDIQWGSEALDFASFLLEHRDAVGCPVLLLLVARDEALAERTLESGQLNDLIETHRVPVLKLGPLSPADHEVLIEKLLGFEKPLAKRVRERTNGNPLFAVQLVGDWVERGVLEVSDRGFALKPGVETGLPDDLFAVWSERLRRFERELLGHRPAIATESTLSVNPVRGALELAAALGREVDGLEWQRACEKAGFSIPIDFLETLSTNRLALAKEGGDWAFVHSMLRESLQREAQEQTRWKALNQICFDSLESHYPNNHRGLAERLGRHLVEAGQLEASLSFLLEAAREHFDSYSQPQLEPLLRFREDVLEQLGLPRDTIRWCEGWVLKAQHLARNQAFGPSLQLAEHVQTLAEKHDWPLILADTLLIVSLSVIEDGHLQRAEAAYGRARLIYETLGNDIGLVRCIRGLGFVARARGQLDAATGLFEESLRLANKCGDPTQLLPSFGGLHQVELNRGNLEAAAEWARQTLELSRQLGNAFGESRGHNSLAEAARFNGDLDLAEQEYREALRISGAIGAPVSLFNLNLSLVLLLRDKTDEARELLNRLCVDYQRTRQRAMLAAVTTGLLLCHARNAEWDLARQRIDETKQLLAETGYFDADLAWPVEQSGDLASDAGESAVACQAYEIACAQWTKLGRTEEAERTKRRLRKLGA